MGITRRSEALRARLLERLRRPVREERGVALFMVLASVAILSLLAAEFTYIANLNQRLAYDAGDSLRAHYVAKSAFKISMLRLKAYQNVKGYISNLTQNGGSEMVPKGLVEKIWSFPFMYPLPTNLPGLSPLQKESIAKFQAASSLQGEFAATIESESSKYNLNMVLAPFAAAQKDKTEKKDGKKDGKKKKQPGTDSDELDGLEDQDDEESGGNVPGQDAQFDAEKARESFREFVRQLFTNKSEDDEDFREEYGSFELDDLINAMIAWMDRKFEPEPPIRDDELKLKQAPYYNVSELHMVPYMDDKLYELLAPHFTVSPTPGVNVNTIRKEMLKALVPEITEEESKEFFEYRDSQKEDNLFRKPDDFFTYLQNNVSHFGGSASAIQDFKKSLSDRNIRIVTEETEFKIEVRANVNQSVRVLEAWVTLKSQPQGGNNAAGGNNAGNANLNPAGTGQPSTLWQGAATKKPDTGLKITFMRIY